MAMNLLSIHSFGAVVSSYEKGLMTGPQDHTTTAVPFCFSHNLSAACSSPASTKPVQSPDFRSPRHEKGVTALVVTPFVSYWCGREDLNQQSGKTAHGLNSTNDCLKAPHSCHFQGITDKSPSAPMPQHVQSMSQDVASLTKISTESLQNFDRTSFGILKVIRDNPGLKAIVTAWASLPISVKAGIVAMVSTVRQNSIS